MKTAPKIGPGTVFQARVVNSLFPFGQISLGAHILLISCVIGFLLAPESFVVLPFAAIAAALVLVSSAVGIVWIYPRDIVVLDDAVILRLGNGSARRFEFHDLEGALLVFRASAFPIAAALTWPIPGFAWIHIYYESQRSPKALSCVGFSRKQARLLTTYLNIQAGEAGVRDPAGNLVMWLPSFRRQNWGFIPVQRQILDSERRKWEAWKALGHQSE